MSLRLPPANADIRRLFDVSDLARLHRDSPIQTLIGAAYAADVTFAEDKAAAAVHFICTMPDDSLVLVRFTRDKPREILWYFGERNDLPLAN